jgi:DNA-binding NarL/FixJ family response regulator
MMTSVTMERATNLRHISHLVRHRIGSQAKQGRGHVSGHAPSKGNVMRILVADSQPRVRFALRVLLEQQPDIQVVGEATDAQGLLAQARVTCPDLVLLGWELPGLLAVDSLSALRKIRSDLLVIALSGRPEARQAALQAGANAFVSKSDPPERLLAAIGGQRKD